LNGWAGLLRYPQAEPSEPNPLITGKFMTPLCFKMKKLGLEYDSSKVPTDLQPGSVSASSDLQRIPVAGEMFPATLELVDI